MSNRLLANHLPFVLIASAVIAFVLSAFLLRRYKRAVLRSMSNRAGGTATSQFPPSQPSRRGTRSEELRNIALGSPARAAFIYAIAGSAYAFVVSISYITAAGSSVTPARVLVVFWNFAWPVAWSVMLVASTTWRSKAVIVAGYFAILCASGLAGLGWQQVLILWTVANFGATALLLCFLTRGIRAVGPLVFTLVLIALIGCDLAVDLLAYDVNHSGALAHAILATGLSATACLALVALCGIAIFAIVGWAVMRRIGHRYEAKKLTDQSITLDSLWIVFAIVHGVFLSLSGIAWALIAVLAFAAYKITLAAGFRLWKPPSFDAPRLLILRVFSLGRRSQRLFNAIQQQWRYAGSIQLIAGPDFASSTIEPHEFLAFLGGKLSRRFIESSQTFQQRLAETDLQRDFDHRFRVTDFFCQDNAWQMVLSRLVNETDAVLMDLRGFTRANTGCVFELQELKEHARAGSVVLIVDGTTSEDFLNETLGESAAKFRFVKTNGRGGKVREIIEAICAAAAAA